VQRPVDVAMRAINPNMDHPTRVAVRQVRVATQVDFISSSDVRGLGLQDVIRGIAAVRLEHEQRKLDGEEDRCEDRGQRAQGRVEGDEDENGFGWQEDLKDEKKAVKKELKGLKRTSRLK
jgi:hypothetical protein